MFLQKSLRNLRDKTKNREIVIGDSDKDGKIVITSYLDYISLITESLNKNYELLPYNEKEILLKITEIKENICQILVEMWEKNYLDDNLLFLTTGIKKVKTGGLRKVSGPSAKHFANNSCGYIYPLYKTHKISPDTLKTCSINKIPTRIVQAAGNTYLSRLTTMLNLILEPISVKYCKFKLNEYCKDSKSYLEDLKTWKSSLVDKNCILSTVDVVNLYPSLTINLVTKAIIEALKSCSSYENPMIKYLVQLSEIALLNNFITFQGKYFKQIKGIITGDNNSVAIANISLHYIMMRTTKLNKALIVRRFIDDIIVISENEMVATEIIEDLKNTFKNYDLKLTSTIMSTDNKINTLPFLDIEHILTKENNKNFFYTKNFTKITAINSTFLNGKSFHPLSTFKAIITGEEKRMKRLNERSEDYYESLKKLKTKCIASNFNLKLTEDQFEKILKGKENENKPVKEKINENIYWSSQFKKILKFTNEESKLFPLGKVAFTKPANLRQLLNNYSQIAKEQQQKKTISKKCKKCALCGNHGQHKNMVLDKEVLTIQGKTIKLKSNLNCKSFGIYVAVCTNCDSNYVGQTKNSFSNRWTAHRANWNKLKSKFKEEDISDECALYRHYYFNHKNNLQNLNFNDAYKVAFLEQPSYQNLDYKEHFWMNKLKSDINLAKTPYSDI